MYMTIEGIMKLPGIDSFSVKKGEDAPGIPYPWWGKEQGDGFRFQNTSEYSSEALRDPVGNDGNGTRCYTY